MNASTFPEAPVFVNTPDRNIKLEDLAFLWKLDDPDWVSQREADWFEYVKPVFKDYPKTEQKLLEQYFIYGKKDKYYPVSDWFFLTLYNTKESLLKLMNSFLLTTNDRIKIIKFYLLRDFFRFSDCPWYRQHMEIFIETYFAGSYTILEEQKKIFHLPQHSGADI